MDWAHFNGNTNLLRVGSINGKGSSATVDYTMLEQAQRRSSTAMKLLARVDVLASHTRMLTGCQVNLWAIASQEA